MRVSVRKAFCTGAIAAGVVVLLAPVGAAGKPRHRHRHPRPQTHITINSWSGETLGGVPYRVKPHQTVTHCASDPEKSLGLRGPAKHVVANRNIVVQFLLNGAVRDTYHEHWTKSGNVVFQETIYNEAGLPDGRWTLKVLQGRKLIGASWIVLAADPSC